MIQDIIDGAVKPFTAKSGETFTTGQLRGAMFAGVVVGAVGGYFGTKKYLTGTF